ncbi:MAG TPA: pantetheine-phosphate adenylyltransferase [Bacteroidia bacterium]|jgi:pantetheine-phosphate adenylyltransferase|nr:pantetheine-phosphate adenylyltransferase [Bacteroidia bacterium]
MKKTAVFPGSFDPVTIGHESIVRRALPLFDELIIAIGVNSNKNYYFPIEKRLEWLRQVFANEPKVKVTSFSGLTVDFCKSSKASYILRGIRTAADFEFEKAIAQMNKAMSPEIETIFILPVAELSAINSTIIRDIVRNGGDASQFVPAGISLV